jgi:hypothetical protein
MFLTLLFISAIHGNMVQLYNIDFFVKGFSSYIAIKLRSIICLYGGLFPPLP